MTDSLFEKRIRQLFTVDKNAYEIYTDLWKNINDEVVRNELKIIAEEEKNHMKEEENTLSLLVGDIS